MPISRTRTTPAQSVAFKRRQFVKRLLAIAPDMRLLWMPIPGDTTTNQTLETSAGRVVTYDATVAARLSQLGRGQAQSFASGSTQYGTTPDTANMSFGTGAADLPFSIVALVNVTDTAAVRQIISKYTTAQTEWQFSINTTDVLTFGIYDDSAAVGCVRNSDAAITQGSWRLLGGTYSGVAGASAGNGITLYQDGAVIASTATNNASYVAMEDKAAPAEIGSIVSHTLQYFDGSMAMVAVCAGALTTAQHAAVYALCRSFYKI